MSVFVARRFLAVFLTVSCLAMFTSAVRGEDCNGNGTPDDQDILSGTSLDCDNDGIPDECEVFEEHKLRNPDPAVSDFFGIATAVDGDRAAIGTLKDDSAGPDAGAVYVYRREGNSWVPESKLTASEGVENKAFGKSVSISGDVIIAGAPGSNYGRGSAYIFRFNGTVWEQEQQLSSPYFPARGSFGASVAVDGDVAVVGAESDQGSGRAYVYRYDGIVWNLETEFAPTDSATVDYFGIGVAVDGNVIAVGAEDYNGIISFFGTVYVYRFDGLNWLQDTRLSPPYPLFGNAYGGTMAIDDDLILVGSPSDNGVARGTGVVFIYRFSEGAWIAEQPLTAADGSHEDYFGGSIAINGDTVAVGARFDDDEGDRQGSAYVFRYLDGAWQQVVKLTASDGVPSDSFGRAISLADDSVLIGSNNGDGVDYAGSVYVFTVPGEESQEDCNGNGVPDRCDLDESHSEDCNSNGIPDECDLDTGASYDCNGNGVLDDCDIADNSSEDCNEDGVPDECQLYTSSKILAPSLQEFALFGTSISIEGDMAVIGASGDNGDDQGSARVYRFDGTHWNQEARLIPSDPGVDDFFGNSVSISGQVIVIGAYKAGDAGASTGSAYVFRWNGSAWVEEDKLMASDGASSDEYGWSVVAHGDLIVVGAQSNDQNALNAGAAYVYRFDGNIWIEEAKLTASDAAERDSLGCSVATNGETIWVGAHGDDPGGSVYVFRHNGVQWEEEPKILARDDPLVDGFGYSIAVEDNRVVVGAPYSDHMGTSSGAAYVYEWNGSAWLEVATLRGSDESAQRLFGWSIALDQRRVVVGAYRTDSYAGSVYVFHDAVHGWDKHYILIPTDTIGYQEFGNAVGISGDYVLAGAWKESEAHFDAGAVYAYELHDSDFDDVIAACDGCPGTVPGVMVDENGCPPEIPGDFDRDGDVDVNDYGVFESCASGAAIPCDEDCFEADLDDDGDVDQSDFGILQRCYSGLNNAAFADCGR